MPQTIHTGYRQLLDQANAAVETLTAARALDLGDEAVLVDLRDPREIEREGRIPGAFHCPRGMLEFWIDPASPYFKPIFGEDKTFIFHCAADWRSALSTQLAQRMGLKPVAHLKGGFNAWKAAGLPVEMPEGKHAKK